METRQCIICKQIKSINEFNFHRRLTGERHTHCRDCQRVYKRNFYLRNREAYIQKSAREIEEKAQRNRSRLREYLSTHPCVDCGETDILVLEFDHVAGKERTISGMVHSGVPWARILGEIDKCQVRCGNCHKKRTAREKGRYKSLGL